MPAYLGDFQVRGTLKADKFDPPAKCIDNAAIEDAAGIEATKVDQQIIMEHRQAHGTAVVTKRETIHVALGAAGELIQLNISLVVKCITGAKVQVMVKKNGTDMLAAALELDDADANYAVVTTSTFISAPYVRNDVFEVVVTPVAGGGTIGQGLLVQLIGREDAE